MNNRSDFGRPGRRGGGDGGGPNYRQFENRSNSGPQQRGAGGFGGGRGSSNFGPSQGRPNRDGPPPRRGYDADHERDKSVPRPQPPNPGTGWDDVGNDGWGTDTAAQSQAKEIAANADSNWNTDDNGWNDDSGQKEKVEQPKVDGAPQREQSMTNASSFSSSTRQSNSASQQRPYQNYARDQQSQNYSRDKQNQNFGRDQQSQNRGRDQQNQNFGRDQRNQNYGRDPQHQSFGRDQQSQNYGRDQQNQNHGRDRTFTRSPPIIVASQNQQTEKEKVKHPDILVIDLGSNQEANGSARISVDQLYEAVNKAAFGTQEVQPGIKHIVEINYQPGQRCAQFQMTTVEAAVYAWDQLNGKELNGRKLIVDFGRHPQYPFFRRFAPKPRAQPQQPSQQQNVHENGGQQQPDYGRPPPMQRELDTQQPKSTRREFGGSSFGSRNNNADGFGGSTYGSRNNNANGFGGSTFGTRNNNAGSSYSDRPRPLMPIKPQPRQSQEDLQQWQNGANTEDDGIKSPPSASAQDRSPSTLLFVSGIEDSQANLKLLTYLEIMQIFMSKVTNLTVLDVKLFVKRGHSQNSPHYALVEVKTLDEAERAIATLNGIELPSKHKLQVDYSQYGRSLVPANRTLHQLRESKRAQLREDAEAERSNAMGSGGVRGSYPSGQKNNEEVHQGKDELQPDEGKPEEEKPEEAQLDEGKPEEAQPDEVKLEETQPEKAQPDEGKPEETQPDERKPEETQPGEGKPEETQPDEGKPEEGKLEEEKPDEGKSEEAQPDEVKLEETQPEKAQPDEGKPEETQPDERKPEETQPGGGKPEETQPDEGKPEEGKLEQEKPDEGKSEEAQPDEVKLEETQPGEGKPEETQPDEGKLEEIEANGETVKLEEQAKGGDEVDEESESDSDGSCDSSSSFSSCSGEVDFVGGDPIDPEDDEAEVKEGETVEQEKKVDPAAVAEEKVQDSCDEMPIY